MEQEKRWFKIIGRNMTNKNHPNVRAYIRETNAGHFALCVGEQAGSAHQGKKERFGKAVKSLWIPENSVFMLFK